MTDADSIWESKVSKVHQPEEKMGPLVELMGE
jgi:hypothetical protein